MNILSKHSQFDDGNTENSIEWRSSLSVQISTIISNQLPATDLADSSKITARNLVNGERAEHSGSPICPRSFGHIAANGEKVLAIASLQVMGGAI